VVLEIGLCYLQAALQLVQPITKKGLESLVFAMRRFFVVFEAL
jgi:hypothetical protein